MNPDQFAVLIEAITPSIIATFIVGMMFMIFGLWFINLPSVRTKIGGRLFGNRDSTSFNTNSGSTDSTNLDGYIILNLSDDKKPIFRDLLNGFEEYAQLKGYKVNVSIISSMKGKIAYRIDIDEHGITKSTDSVKKDLKDYMKEIQSGGSSKFKDMPKVTSEIEHERIITTLRNRIATLEVNYQLEKRSNDFLMYFARIFPQGAISHSSQPIQIFNRTTDMNDNRNFEANNSTGITQGDNSNTLLEGNTINIGANYAEKSELINRLDALLIAMKDNSDYSEASRNIENIKEEIIEATEPDISRIQKWLDKAKSVLSAAEQGGEVLQKAMDAYEALGSPIS